VRHIIPTIAKSYSVILLLFFFNTKTNADA
jgi:hypothetical protein